MCVCVQGVSVRGVCVREGCPGGDVSVRGVSVQGGVSQHAMGQTPPPHVDRILDTRL